MWTGRSSVLVVPENSYDAVPLPLDDTSAILFHTLAHDEIVAEELSKSACDGLLGIKIIFLPISRPTNQIEKRHGGRMRLLSPGSPYAMEFFYDSILLGVSEIGSIRAPEDIRHALDKITNTAARVGWQSRWLNASPNTPLKHLFLLSSMPQQRNEKPIGETLH